jgi:hypothetical protein
VTAILRLSPGEATPWAGTYALVREWGEPTGVAVWRDKGDALPLITVSEEGPLWYVLVGEPIESAQAA